MSWDANDLLIGTGQSLRKADNIIVLSANGSIVEQGSFDTLKKSGGYVEDLCKHYADQDNTNNSASKPASQRATTEIAQPDETHGDILHEVRKPRKTSIYFFYLRSLGVSNAVTFATLSLLFTGFLRFPGIIAWRP